MDDDSPKGIVEELRKSVLKKRIGQIALAVVLAEAIWRLISAFTWNLIIPIIGKSLHGQTESVLFEAESSSPIPWDKLFGSLLEFLLVIIMVIFLNRWIQRKPAPPKEEESAEDDPLRGTIIQPLPSGDIN